jgi:hypothetical protein
MTGTYLTGKGAGFQGLIRQSGAGVRPPIASKRLPAKHYDWLGDHRSVGLRRHHAERARSSVGDTDERGGKQQETRSRRRGSEPPAVSRGVNTSQLSVLFERSTATLIG